ncbi:hypothetical protein MPC4_20070 [Methylocella tundrae]|uniref:Uncharacterized protein n=1 Tax=Methylocella tundrae TaxID=227605 RepID=A0A8B6M6B5_METTU|nr:hypothetical protein MPC1_10980001 [Methylocella tundrae]VTZ49860.1 hypothetical protein MPC4_20070 [Methylocella tundrae]
MGACATVNKVFALRPEFGRKMLEMVAKSQANEDPGLKLGRDHGQLRCVSRIVLERRTNDVFMARPC